MSNGNGTPGSDDFSEPPPGYEEKFADFIAMVEEAVADLIELVVIDNPRVLGDTYEEVIESLSLLADAELALQVVSR